MALKRSRFAHHGSQRWAGVEDDYIRAHYPSAGLAVVAAALGRSEASVKGRATALGITRAGFRAWTASESDYLRAHYPSGSVSEIAAHLGRSRQQIAQRACTLGIRRTAWFTEADGSFIQTNYRTLGPVGCAAALGRSERSIMTFVSRQGWGRKLSEAFWDEESDRLLMQLYPTSMGRAEIARRLGRSRSAVQSRASALGVYRPTLRSADLRPLLSGTAVASYWIGFLLADGSFRGKSLSVSTTKDEDHLRSFAAFVGGPAVIRTERSWMVAVMHASAVPEIMARFGIDPTKTVTPPPLPIFSRLGIEDLTAMLIGFFDGDGTTRSASRRLGGERKLGGGMIAVHKSWADLLGLWSARVSAHLGAPSRAFLYTRRTPALGEPTSAYLFLSVGIMRALKRFAVANRLPVLDRKWWFPA